VKNILGLATGDGARRNPVGARHKIEVLERDRIGTFLAFLQDRRALYAPGRNLSEKDTRISVEKICHEC
jgi:hypothetical protein